MRRFIVAAFFFLPAILPALLPSGAEASSDAVRHIVTVPGCRHGIAITLPKGFAPAVTPKEKSIEAEMNRIRSMQYQKPGPKARYFSDNWNARRDLRSINLGVHLTPEYSKEEKGDSSSDWQEYRKSLMADPIMPSRSSMKAMLAGIVGPVEAQNLLSANDSERTSLFIITSDESEGRKVVWVVKYEETDSCGIVTIGYSVPFRKRKELRPFLIEAGIE